MMRDLDDAGGWRLVRGLFWILELCGGRGSLCILPAGCCCWGLPHAGPAMVRVVVDGSSG
jgi:hypothetical protein